MAHRDDAGGVHRAILGARLGIVPSRTGKINFAKFLAAESVQ